jgi:hypothetical protein
MIKCIKGIAMINKNEIYAWCDSCGAELSREQTIFHKCEYGREFCKECFVMNKIYKNQPQKIKNTSVVLSKVSGKKRFVDRDAKDNDFSQHEQVQTEMGIVFVPKSATTKREMDLVRLTQLLVEGKSTVKTCGLLGGEFGYGTEFENDVFMMHPFCWCAADDCKWCREDAPQFIFKKSELRIHWYKWIGRDMRYSQELSDAEWNAMIKECKESVKND